MAETDAMSKALEEDHEWIELKDVEGFDQALRFRPPKAGAIAYLIARMQSGKQKPTDIAKFINHVVALMDEDTQEVVEDRLFDPDSDFDIDELIELWSRIVEDEGGRPTESASDSSESRQNGGKKSTAKASVRASTSQKSRSTGS